MSASLVFQDRSISGPAAHILLVGVSDYSNLTEMGVAGDDRTLGLNKLHSPALSAFRLGQTFTRIRDDLPQPLATVRMLLSPSEAEARAEPKLRRPYVVPTLESFTRAAREWRADARSHDQNLTIFYFGGHGLQVTKDNVMMLMADFAAPGETQFHAAVPLRNILFGMAPSAQAPLVAQTQFYFIDACRSRPELGNLQLPSGTAIFDEFSASDRRSTPTFYASVSGEEAKGRTGSISYFCDALLDALEIASEHSAKIPVAAATGAAQQTKQVWPVTAHAMQDVIFQRFAAWNIEQVPTLSNVASQTAVLRNLSRPPLVEFSIEIARPELIGATELEVLNSDRDRFATITPYPPNHPYQVTAPMGFYFLSARNGPPAAAHAMAPEMITFRFDRWPVEIP